MGSAIKSIGGVIGVIVGTLTAQPWLVAASLSMLASGFQQFLGEFGGNLAAKQGGFQVNITSTDAPLPVIYGETMVAPRIADTRVDPNSTDGKDLCWVGAISVASEGGGGISSVQEVYFDERLAIDAPSFESEPVQDATIQTPWRTAAPVYFLEYGIHAGADAQVMDAELNSRFSSDYVTATKGRGIAYLYLGMTYDEDTYPNGIPNVRCLVRGQLLYDCRDTSTAWSQNPALCVLDYLTSKRYGVGALYSERDGGSISEIDEASFVAAANYFDEDVSTPAGNQDRFTCNGIIDTSRSHLDNLNQLLSSCRSDLVYQGGKFRLCPRMVDTAVTFELDESNIIGDWSFARAGIKNTGNRIAVRFVDATTNYRMNEAYWPESDVANSMLTNDNSWEHLQSVDLPFTDDYYRALQLGMTLLRESREDWTCMLTAKEEALKLQCGEIVKLTHSTPAWTEKLFRVAAIGINPDATVRLVLREYDDNAYSLDTLNTRDTLAATGLPDPFTCDPPTGFGVTASSATALLTQDGLYVPRALCEWTPPAAEPFLAGYQLQFKLSADSEYEVAPNPAKAAVQAYVWPLTDAVDYDFRIRAVNTLGVTSVWVEDNDVTVSTTAGTFPIGAPQFTLNPSQSGSTGTVTIDVYDPDLAVWASGLTFKKKDDAGAWGGTWLTSWNSETGTPGTDTELQAVESISLIGKHNVSIKVQLKYTYSGVTWYEHREHTFDSDQIAEIDSIAVDYNASNQVRTSIKGDEDVASIYAKIGINSTPTGVSSGVYDVTTGSWQGNLQSTVTCAMGSTVCVKAVGYDSGSAKGPIVTNYFLRGDTPYQPYSMELNPTQSGASGILTVLVKDPSSSITASGMKFQKKVGRGNFGGSWLTSWDTSTGGTIGTATSFTLTESVALQPKGTSQVKVQVNFLDINGNAASEVRSHTFDADLIAEVTNCSLSFDSSNNIVVTAGGDEDTASLWFNLAIATGTPAAITGTASDSGSIAARSGVDTTAVTCSPGVTAKIKIAGKDSGGTLGPTLSFQQERESVEPRLRDVRCFVEDTGSDNIYDVSWARNSAVSDALHRVDVSCYENEVWMQDAANIVPSDDGDEITDTGAGDGSADYHHVTVFLTTTSDVVLQSVTTRRFLSGA